jgi:hypothetical protein
MKNPFRSDIEPLRFDVNDRQQQSRHPGWVPGLNPLLDVIVFMDDVCQNQVTLARTMETIANNQVRLARRALIQSIAMAILGLAVLLTQGVQLARLLHAL